MSDLIERQAAIDMFQNLAYDDWNQRTGTTWADAFSEAAEMIRDLPSAQPDLDSAYTEGYTQAEAKYRKMWDEMQATQPERKTGRLVNPTPYGECSECGFLIDSREGYNFCPNCGARMAQEGEQRQSPMETINAPIMPKGKTRG